MVTSDGVLAPATGERFCQNLLSCLNHTEIPVVAGEALPADAPPFRFLNESLAWPACSTVGAREADSNQMAASAIVTALHRSEEKVLYLCLGPMTNLAAAIRMDPAIASKIHRVVYQGGAPGGGVPGWNTNRDPAAAQTVYKAGLTIYGLSLPDYKYLALGEVFNEVRNLDSKAADLLVRTHDVAAIQEKIADGHMKVWDEMTVICINMISGFDFLADARYEGAMQLARFDEEVVKSAYLQLLGNPADFHIDQRKSVVLTEFPSDPALMRGDVAPLVQEIIDRHGMEEWKACLLTNELHRHLGIYSLVGAKMGTRAREILEAPFDTLSVTSLAGLSPPLSCLNDGLQVSTGASLGRGTIAVLEDSAIPAARFTNGEYVLQLTLKPAYVDRIKSDIRAAVEKYGGLGPDYFAHIRTLSIQYWKDLDRMELFEARIIK
jgi:pyrimidine-specific ribonucleoside hydrolase